MTIDVRVIKDDLALLNKSVSEFTTIDWYQQQDAAIHRLLSVIPDLLAAYEATPEAPIPSQSLEIENRALQYKLAQMRYLADHATQVMWPSAKGYPSGWTLDPAEVYAVLDTPLP